MYDARKFCELLDYLVSHPSINPACRACHIDPSSFWGWLKKSSEGDARFKFSWGGEVDFFHSHYMTARKRNVVLLEAHLRQLVSPEGGVRRQLVHDGQLVPELDRRFLDWSDEEMLALGFKLSERYVRDALGRIKIATVLEPPSTFLSVKAAAALMPNLWGETRNLNINVAESGVLIVGRRKPERSEGPSPPEQIEQQVEQQIEQVEKEEIMERDDTIDQPGDSELVRSLRAKLRAGVQHPQPAGPVAIARSDEAAAASGSGEGDPPELVDGATVQTDAPLPTPMGVGSRPVAPQPPRDLSVGVGPDPRNFRGSVGFKIG